MVVVPEVCVTPEMDAGKLVTLHVIAAPAVGEVKVTILLSSPVHTS